MKCPECRTLMQEEKRDAYKYKDCGLSNVTLMGVVVHRCPNCGEDAVAIPRLAELHEVIASATAQKDSRLVGEEIRFLRKYLGWSGAQFASVMGVSRETVSRWETDATPMGTQAERLLRVMVFRLQPVAKYPNENLASLGVSEAMRKYVLQIMQTSRGWSVAPSAAKGGKAGGGDSPAA